MLLSFSSLLLLLLTPRHRREATTVVVVVVDNARLSQRYILRAFSNRHKLVHAGGSGGKN